MSLVEKNMELKQGVSKLIRKVQHLFVLNPDFFVFSVTEQLSITLHNTTLQEAK